MTFPNPEMLLYCGIADALTVPAEFNRGNIGKRIIADPSHYYEHPKGDVGLGSYSDDTEMSAANANVLIQFEPRDWTVKAFAQSYINEFNRGGRRKGYARRFYDFLCKTADAEDFLANIQARSTKNGAMMRASVFGVLRDVEYVKFFAQTQASITHNTPEGIFSAKAIALASHFALWTNRPLSTVREFIADHLPESRLPFVEYIFREDWKRPVNGTYAPIAIETTHAALHLLTHETQMMEMIKQTLRWGGDVDSVAAVAWSIASARYRDQFIPNNLKSSLEQGNPKTGAPYLIDLGERLMKKFDVDE